MSVLRAIDRGLGWLGWALAAGLVLMLFIGPQVVAEDEPQPAEQAPAAESGGADGAGAAASDLDGELLFVDNCSGCHTLSAAGASGTVGPSLDAIAPTAAEVAATVSDGRGGMPSFADSLDQAEIDAIAQYVASAAGS